MVMRGGVDERRVMAECTYMLYVREREAERGRERQREREVIDYMHVPWCYPFR